MTQLNCYELRITWSTPERSKKDRIDLFALARIVARHGAYSATSESDISRQIKRTKRDKKRFLNENDKNDDSVIVVQLPVLTFGGSTGFAKITDYGDSLCFRICVGPVKNDLNYGQVVVRAAGAPVDDLYKQGIVTEVGIPFNAEEMTKLYTRIFDDPDTFEFITSVVNKRQKQKKSILAEYLMPAKQHSEADHVEWATDPFFFSTWADVPKNGRHTSLMTDFDRLEFRVLMTENKCSEFNR